MHSSSLSIYLQPCNCVNPYNVHAPSPFPFVCLSNSSLCLLSFLSLCPRSMPNVSPPPPRVRRPVAPTHKDLPHSPSLSSPLRLLCLAHSFQCSWYQTSGSTQYPSRLHSVSPFRLLCLPILFHAQWYQTTGSTQPKGPFASVVRLLSEFCVCPSIVDAQGYQTTSRKNPPASSVCLLSVVSVCPSVVDAQWYQTTGSTQPKGSSAFSVCSDVRASYSSNAMGPGPSSSWNFRLSPWMTKPRLITLSHHLMGYSSHQYHSSSW